MKIPEMDKEQLINHMKASRELYRFDEDLHSWKRAISLYKQATGMKFDADCSGCRRRLVEWLTGEQQ